MSELLSIDFELDDQNELRYGSRRYIRRHASDVSEEFLDCQRKCLHTHDQIEANNMFIIDYRRHSKT